MTVTELKTKIKNSTISGAYIFCGEEDYLKKYYLGEIVKLCCPDEAFSLFNRTTFDGAEVDIEEIAEAVKSPPMMSDMKLVEWKYADLEHLTEAQKTALEEIAASLEDYPYAVFIIYTDAEDFDGGNEKHRPKTAKRLEKHFSIVNFEKSTDVQLISWLRRHFENNGISADNDTLAALLFRSGHSMEVLNAEVEKLSAYAGAHSLSTITKTEVDLVASSTIECDAFALSDAISNRNKEKAFLALEEMEMRRTEPRIIFGSIAKSLTEILSMAYMLKDGKDTADIEGLLGWKPYRIKICINAAKKWEIPKLAAALSSLREMDAKSKRGGTAGYKMLKTFICQCL